MEWDKKKNERADQNGKEKMPREMAEGSWEKWQNWTTSLKRYSRRRNGALLHL